MAIRLSSGAFVETVVTLAAAALMTLAGAAMLEGIRAPAAGALARAPTAAGVAAPQGPASVPQSKTAMPHVDQTIA
jgi:hypothetical protein